MVKEMLGQWILGVYMDLAMWVHAGFSGRIFNPNLFSQPKKDVLFRFRCKLDGSWENMGTII